MASKYNRVHLLQKTTAESRLARHGLELDESMHPKLDQIEGFGKGKYIGTILAHEIKPEELQWPSGTTPTIAKAGHTFRKGKANPRERDDFVAAVEHTYEKKVANSQNAHPNRLFNSAWHAIDGKGNKVLFVDNEFLPQQQEEITALQLAKYHAALEQSQKK